ncbi:zinc ribbon domain-containing protein [Butyrivibrio sp. AC2005]|uniref:zinc ribbon domain-containing protein n=1 Tax=Butyrivibrio sp. AC2005 TaxID=1280672 RepID=UPI0004109018|nr:zinc ribbon domain-containing protein [Butyrivibrio sp. AC2005]
MGKFCVNCGTRLEDGAKFCPNCGKGVGKKSASKRVSVESKTELSSDQKTPHKSSTKVKKSRINILLVVVMVIEFLVAGYKFPGFLVKDKSKKNLYERLSDLAQGNLDMDSFGKEDDVSVSEINNDGVVLSADEIPLKYSQEQIEKAEIMTADVTPDSEGVTMGDIRVDIPSWELESEGDQIEVKNLPVLSQGDEGWSIHAYDFSLASGTHEFDSDITISIPREGDAKSLSGCVWYNEETGTWEDIYSEISEDGKYYTIYTDHFSLFGEKKYRFDEKRLDLVIDDGRRIDLDHGVFIETQHSNKSRMLQPVRIDYERFWNMYQLKTIEDVKDIGNSIKLLIEKPKEIEALTYTPTMDTAADLFDYADATDGIFWIGKGISEGLIAPASEEKISLREIFGHCMTIADVVFTSQKVKSEALSNTTTPYAEALFQAILDHDLDVFNTASGVALNFAPEVLNPLAGAIGVAIFAYCQGYETFISDGVDEWYKQYYPDEGEVYRRFYEDAGVRLYFDTEDMREKAQADYHYALMDKPSSMDDKKYEEFSKFINERGGLRTDNYKGFAPAFSKLVELYIDEPEYLETIFDELFRSVAGAFWKLPEKQTAGAAGQGPRHEFMKKYKYLGNDPFNMPRAEQIKLSDAYVMKQKVDSIPILENVATTYQRKACESVIQKMEKELLPALNRTLVFHVTDGSLSSGQTFADSVYCVDWTTINSNRKYRSLPDGENVFGSDFKTPIRFKGVDKPLFLPLDIDGTENSEKNYYPYDPGFLPRANKKSDIVFKCTYYHYLMMGAPQKMVFTDLKTGEETEADIVIPDIDLKDGSYTIDINIMVKGAEPEKEGSEKFKKVEYKLRAVGMTDIGVLIPIEYRPQNVTVNLGEDGSIKIDAPKVEYLEELPDKMGGKVHYKYERGGFHAQGTVEYHVFKDGYEIYHGNLAPGVSYTSGRTTTGVTPAAYTDSGVDIPYEEFYGSTLNQSRGDSEFDLKIDTNTRIVWLVLSFKGSVTEWHSTNGEPFNDDDYHMEATFSTTGYRY